MFLLLVDLERAELRHVFSRGVTRVTAVGQGDDPDSDQNEPDDAGRFHGDRSLRATGDR